MISANREVYTNEEVADLLASFFRNRNAEIARNLSDIPQTVHVYDLDLSTAKTIEKAFRIGVSFKSMFIISASDTEAVINVKVGTNSQHQKPFQMKQNASVTSDRYITNAYLYWDAQAGKTMKVVIFTEAKFESGQQINITSGGISISTGSIASGPTRVTLAATTATIIAAASTTRKQATIENNTGADLYVGGSSSVTNSGATRGLKIPVGGFIYWQNSAALYGYSEVGGDVHILTES